MKVSLNEIRKYVEIPVEMTTEKLVELIAARLVEVEEAVDLAPKYQGIYIAKVVECEPIPETHLHLCKIDVGDKGVEFNPDQHGLVQVVCGAPNVHKGMLAVWITPGSIVPATFGEENFKLSVRKLRGYESYGMLAGADELGFSNEHRTIAEIDPNFAKAGDNFAEKFELNDVILDIENKSLTRRPDTFGLIGFAREVAGVLNLAFKTGEVKANFAAKIKDLIKIEDAEICPYYSLAVAEVKAAAEKNKYLDKTAVFLAKAGMQSVSKLVDITNVVMLQTGQPLHAFDYDKVLEIGGEEKLKIGVRRARVGEKLQLLNEKTIECDTNDILITSGEEPIALAGAMGGKNTEVDASTKRIILEAATFSLYNLRKTQMKHGIFSEAITRFTKGQPTSSAAYALKLALALIDGQIETIDNLAHDFDFTDTVLQFAEEAPALPKKTKIKFGVETVNDILGTNYSADDMAKTLENVEFKVEKTKDNSLAVAVPVWRNDIEILEDIAEEIGRLRGYENIDLALPQRPMFGTKPNPMYELKAKIRNILSDQLAAHEILTYSFVNQVLELKTGENPENSYKIVNALSPDLQDFRQNLLPSLLVKTSENLKAGYDEFSLYEFNQVTNKKLGLDAEKVPMMQQRLGLTTVGNYYAAKQMLDNLCKKMNLSFELKPVNAETQSALPFFEPLHAAMIIVERQIIGVVGEIKANVARKLKIQQMISGFELDLTTLLLTRPTKKEIKISKFPKVERDITFELDQERTYAEIEKLVQENLSSHKDLMYMVQPISIYQAEKSKKKRISLHLEFSSLKQTLSGKEITDIMEKIAKTAEKVGAKEV